MANSDLVDKIRQHAKRGNNKLVNNFLNDHSKRSQLMFETVVRACFQPDEKKNTAIHYCAKKNHKEVALTILNFAQLNRVRIKEFGAGLHSTEHILRSNISKDLIQSKGQDGVLPLHLAAAYYGKGCVDDDEGRYTNSVMQLLLDWDTVVFWNEFEGLKLE